MKPILLAISIILASIVSVAAQQNPYQHPYGSSQQERQEPQLQYNPFEQEWSYERQGETLQYNPFEDEWNYARPDSQLRYNPFEDRWERE
ncbi:hypothetical protein LCGC14_2520300 [marine sediment metagenome]|uniref:Uncharacterized protein n=1 Tax=marine sediment metagenome TaxID=412755 RepID=A0A0F9AX17_9ZZZZ